MKNFTWWNPTIVLFGRGAVLQLADQLEAAGIESVLLLYGGKAIFKNGAYAQVAEALTKKGIAFPELGGVRPNPRVDKVREAVAGVPGRGDRAGRRGQRLRLRQGRRRRRLS